MKTEATGKQKLEKYNCKEDSLNLSKRKQSVHFYSNLKIFSFFTNYHILSRGQICELFYHLYGCSEFFKFFQDLVLQMFLLSLGWEAGVQWMGSHCWRSPTLQMAQMLIMPILRDSSKLQVQMKQKEERQGCWTTAFFMAILNLRVMFMWPSPLVAHMRTHLRYGWSRKRLFLTLFRSIIYLDSVLE